MELVGGQTAVVTGAGSGIGLALARRLAERGLRVVLADVDGDAVAAAAATIDPPTLCCTTDVADPASVEELARAAIDEFGAVHLLCNNAGVVGASPSPVWQTPLETWQWVLGVNLMGIVHGLRAFLPRMIASGQPGHVVNTSSLAGLITFPGGVAYGPSKHAAVALTEMLALQLAEQQVPIGVSLLCPAWVRTGILDDERNRPGHLRPDTSDTAPDSVRASLAASMASTGLDPDHVAKLTLDAVRERRFYVLPNPEWTSAISERARRITAGEAPLPPVPDQSR